MDRVLCIALHLPMCSNFSHTRALESTVQSSTTLSNRDCRYLTTGWARAAMAIARLNLQATR